MTRAAIVNSTMFSDEPPSLIRNATKAPCAIPDSANREDTLCAIFIVEPPILIVGPHGGHIQISCRTEFAVGREGRTNEDRCRNSQAACAERKCRGDLHQRCSVANAA